MSGFENDTRLELARYFSEGKVRQWEEQGLAFLEGGREGALVTDSSAAKRFLDCAGGAGTFNLGRRHPALVRALAEAIAETDQGNFPMISKEKAHLAHALAAFAPGKLSCAVFAVMRGETVEFACKVARGATGRQEIIGFDGAWHGETGFALTLSERGDKHRYGALMPGVRRLPFGDIEAARSQITKKTALVIIEPVQIENHCRESSREYLHELRRLCTKTGALLCMDETQTGFGRTGQRFAYEAAGVEPDLLILGEALAGGMFPIAAVLLTRQVNRFLDRHPLIHLSTFGGSDVGCRVAAAALEVYEKERPWANAARWGQELGEGLRGLAAHFPALVRSVAGKGLVWSLKMANPEAAGALRRTAAGHGLLVSTGRVDRSSVLLRPSLLVREAEIEAVIHGLSVALKESVLPATHA